jgi:hypothetical protein
LACTRPPRALLRNDRPGSCVSGCGEHHGDAARSWETIGRGVVVSGCGEHHGDAGRREIGLAAAVEDAAVAAAAQSKASLDRAPDRTGCDATGRGMVMAIGRSALWRGVCSLGCRLPMLPVCQRLGLAAPRLAACCCARRGAVRGLPSPGLKTDRRSCPWARGCEPSWRFRNKGLAASQMVASNFGNHPKGIRSNSWTVRGGLDGRVTGRASSRRYEYGLQPTGIIGRFQPVSVGQAGDSIMAGGNTIQPHHYVTFAEELHDSPGLGSGIGKSFHPDFPYWPKARSPCPVRDFVDLAVVIPIRVTTKRRAPRKAFSPDESGIAP